MIDAERYEVVSFDCYGTLIDRESGIVSGLKPLLANYGVEATGDEILELQARTEHRLRSSSVPGDYVKYRDVLGQQVREAGRRRRFEPDSSKVGALADSLGEREPFFVTVWVHRRSGKEDSGTAPPTDAEPDIVVPDLKTLASELNA